MLIHKIRQPIESDADYPPVLFLLQGQGGDENVLLKFAAFFDPRFLLVSVRAPYPFLQDDGGYTWYEIPGCFSPDPQQFEESLYQLKQLILDFRRYYPVDVRRIFVLGFSQGGVLSYAFGLVHPELVRGIVAHSGYIPEILQLPFAWDRLQTLSVFAAHGTNDAKIPVSFARRAHDLLMPTAASLTYKEYPSSHKISRQSLRDLSVWFREKLAVPDNPRG